jgi:lipoprotein-releasing system permease protein
MIPALVWIVLTGAAALIVMTDLVAERRLARWQSSTSFPAIVIESERVDPSIPRNLFGTGPAVEVATHAPPRSDREVKPYQEMMARAERASRAVSGVAPFVLLEGVLRNGSHFATVSVRGVDEARERSLGRLPRAIVSGSIQGLSGASEGVVIGESLARELGLRPGRQAGLVTPTGEVQTLTVIGTFRTGDPEIDRGICYIDLALAQRLKGMEQNAVTGIGVEVRDPGEVDEVARTLDSATGYRAVPRRDLEATRLSVHRWEIGGGMALVGLLLLAGMLGLAVALRPAPAETLSASPGGMAAEGIVSGLIGGSLAVALGTLAITLLDARSFLPSIAADGAVHYTAVPLSNIASVDLLLFGLVIAASFAAALPASLALRRRTVRSAEERTVRSAEEVSAGTFGQLRRSASARLRRHPRRAAVILTAMSGAAMLLVVLLSFFDGLLDTFTARITEVGPQVTMTAISPENVRRDLLVDNGGIPAAIELVKRVERKDRPRIRNAMTYTRAIEELYGRRVLAASPVLATEALVAFGANQATIPIRGVLPERERTIVDLADHLRSGSIRRLEMEWNSILLGSRIAERLGIRTGERMRLVSLAGESYIVQVAGIYALGVETYDRGALVNLRLAEALEHALPGEANAIELRLRDRATAPAVAADLAELTGRRTETWKETHAGSIAAYRGLRDLFVAVGVLLVILAGLAASLLMPEPDAGDEMVRGGTAVAMIEGGMLGLMAGLLGAILGAVAVALLAFVPGHALANAPALIELSTLPMRLDISYLAVAAGGTLLAGLLAGLLAAPARSADSVQSVVQPTFLQ